MLEKEALGEVLPTVSVKKQFGKDFWILVFVVLGIIFSILGFIVWYFGLLGINIGKPFIVNIKNEFPTPTPFLFEELTIPYLRNKDYSSKLGDLEKYAENNNYNSYLTSYTSDGLKINGLITVPKSEKPTGGYPAIVFVHGYIPPTLYKTVQESYSSYVDFLARNGFIVFKIDLRGHDKSEGQPGGAYYSSDYVIDTLSAVSALGNFDQVDPDMIGLWGHSMAGNVVSRSLMVKPDLKAGVIWAGAVYTYEDLAKFGISDNSYRPPSDNTERQRRRQILRETYGEFDKNNWFWKQVAITDFLDSYKGAIQLHHALNDDVVSIEYSQNLNQLLDKTSIPHEFYQYPSGGHNLEGASFTLAMNRTVEFFKKYLK